MMFSRNVCQINLFILTLMLIINSSDCASHYINDKVNLRDSGSYVIASYDDEDYDENLKDLIDLKDTEHADKLVEEEIKYGPLHSHVARYNNRMDRSENKFTKALNDSRRIFTRSLKSVSNHRFRTKKRFKKQDDSAEDSEDEDDQMKLSTSPEDNEYFENENQTIWIETSTTELAKSTTEEYEDENYYDEEITSISSPKYNTEATDLVDITKNTPEIVNTTGNPVQTTPIKKKIENLSTSANTIDSMYSTKQLERTTASEYELETSPTSEITGKPSGYTRKNEEITTNYINSTKENEQTTSNENESTHPTTEKSLPISTSLFPRSTKRMDSITEDESTENDSKIKKTKKTTKEWTTISIWNTTIEQSTTSISTTEEIEPVSDIFEKIMPDYDFEIEDIKSDNFTYNFTEDEIEKSIHKLLVQSFDFKKPKNCSEFKGFKYGITAIECVISDLKNSKNSTEVKQVLWKSWIIIRVWICIYIIIAIPCWCQKGWCCCCCRCKFCFPRKIIMKEKQYYSKNPPGVLIDLTEKKGKSSSEPEKYEPTIFEEDAYEKFETTVRNL